MFDFTVCKGFLFLCLCLLTNSHSIPNFHLKKLKNYLFISNLNCLMTFPSPEASLCHKEAGDSEKRECTGFPGIPSGTLCRGDRPKHQRRAFHDQKYHRRLLIYLICPIVKTVEGHQHFMINFHDILGSDYFSHLIVVMFFCLICLYSRISPF